MCQCMQTETSLKSMKILLITFNVIFLILGVLLLTQGIWLHLELLKHIGMSPDSSGTGSTSPSVYMIGFAAVLFLFLAVLPCYCTYKEQPILFYVYAGFLGILFVVDVGVCVSGYALSAKMEERIHEELTISIATYGVPTDFQRTYALNSLQSKYHCCGVESYREWMTSPIKGVPGSCCKDKVRSCDTHNVVHISKMGCQSVLNDFFKAKMRSIGACALALGFFQLLGIFLTVSLAKLLAAKKQTGNNLIFDTIG